ncbi:Chlorophyllase-1 [Dichanthelium oligosanthes]|uniref:Chlorophyllase-1 n=1 Tax=Dichanthelium oligosanthes TaxID=888268 RepID=A0A1E5VDI0_9POAL|nr:Chlorophyllase-1 [Dichanthelium oligosanthes]
MAAPVLTTMATQQVVEPAVVTSVFQPGKLSVEVIPVDHDALPTPPIPILIAAPKDAGTYPVAMLLHGFFLQNRFYEQLLKHVASFGFIMVAPQFHTSLVSNGDADDITAAVKVTDWLPGGLPTVLPAGVEADLSKLALAGHSRGGHTAFSLALGHAKTVLSFSALIGLDPVAGTGRSSQLPPAILTYEPSSFDIAAPVLVIGTGLGDDRENVLFPPCAPRDVNHAEFYYECRPPCYHLVTKDYGHLDMLDDDAPKLVTCLCKEGNSCKDVMRRTVAGIMVAFLRSALGEEYGDDLKVILRDPGLAPTTLDPVEYRLA